MDNSVEKPPFPNDGDAYESASQSPTFSRYSAEAEDDRLLDEESLTMATSKGGARRRRDSLKAWAQSRWRTVRYTPRRVLLLILCPILVIEFLYLMISEPAWTMTLHQAGSKLGTQLPSYAWLWAPGKYSSYYGGDADQTDKPIKRALPIKSHLEFLKDNAKYLEAWVARGEVLPGLNFEQHDQIDGLWSWCVLFLSYLSLLLFPSLADLEGVLIIQQGKWKRPTPRCGSGALRQ